MSSSMEAAHLAEGRWEGNEGQVPDAVVEQNNQPLVDEEDDGGAITGDFDELPLEFPPFVVKDEKRIPGKAGKPLPRSLSREAEDELAISLPGRSVSEKIYKPSNNPPERLKGLAIRGGVSHDVNLSRAVTLPITNREKTNAFNLSTRGESTDQSPLALLMRRLTVKGTFTKAKPTFLCLICYENAQVTDCMAPMQPNPTCTHSFCTDCIRSYFNAHIKDGVLSHPCPMLNDNGCKFMYSEEDIRAVVDPDVYHKQVKFSLMKENRDYRECPKADCHNMMLGNQEEPAMVCDKCGTSFCFFHNDAHPNMTCQQYTCTRRRAEKVAEKQISTFAKACPGCHGPTEKSGGCNHMTCRHCGFQWCWICRSKYTTDHYDASNLFGCPGQQMVSSWEGFGTSSPVMVYFLRACLLLVVMPMASFGIGLIYLITALYFPFGVFKWGCYSRHQSTWRAYTIPLVDIMIKQNIKFSNFIGGSFEVVYFVCLLMHYAFALLAGVCWFVMVGAACSPWLLTNRMDKDVLYLAWTRLKPTKDDRGPPPLPPQGDEQPPQPVQQPPHEQDPPHMDV